MSSHFKWYPSSDDVVVPWNAQYEFPSYGNKAVKITPRISPKNGPNHFPASTIRLDFPAQGYVNPANTTLAFDVVLSGHSDFSTAATGAWATWMQNNITSVFKKMRLLYGSVPIETLNECGYLVRQLTEVTCSNAHALDQSSIHEGIAHNLITPASTGDITGSLVKNYQARALAHGVAKTDNTTVAGVAYPNTYTAVAGKVSAIRRYQITLPLGLFNQGKLIPTKWMASQVAIEMELAPIAECVMGNSFVLQGGTPVVGTPAYYLTNVVMVPEILEFDSSYDKMFLEGLQTGGIPIQLSTFNFNSAPVNGSIIQMIIPEKSRSLKNLFVYCRQTTASIQNDYGASFGSIGPSAALEYYQVRVGGRYYPASPVLSTTFPGVRIGGGEPFTELEKCLGVVGDKRLSTYANSQTWGKCALALSTPLSGYPTIYGADDGQLLPQAVNPASTIDANGFPLQVTQFATTSVALTRYAAGSGHFAMAICLETSNGREITGLNAEEQSDIVFNCKWSVAPPSGYELAAFTHIDKIIVLKENNMLDIVE
jgi:hypothetical protein